jgi:microcystin-dependent protein
MSDNSVGDYKFSAQTVDNGFWFKCDGRTLLKSDYPDLHAVIGISFGHTNDYTFKIPNARGRVVGMAGNPTTTYGDNHIMGQSTGDEQHQISESEMPAHTHTYTRQTGIAAPAVSLTTMNVADDNDTTSNTGSTGGSTAMTIMQPTLFIGNLFILWKTN